MTTSSSLARAFRRTPPRDVLIVMLSAVGDAVHVLPVVTALKRTWPNTRITWVIQPLPHTLVAGHPGVDRFLVFERRRGLGAWKSYVALRETLRGSSFDVCLSLQVSAKAGLIQRLAPARVRIGFDWTRARDLNWFLNDLHLPSRPDAHVQDQYLEFVEFLGVEAEPLDWGLHLTATVTAARDRFFGGLDGPAIGFVLGATDARRDWTPEGYAQVIDSVAERFGTPCLLLGGPSKKDSAMAEGILRSCRGGTRPIDLTGDGLRRMLWLLDGCALVVSPDTGPLHMARAMGTPVVGLDGRTNPRRAGPYRAFEHLLVDGYANRPGERYGASRSYRDGMRRIRAVRVLEAIEAGLGNRVRSSARSGTV